MTECVHYAKVTGKIEEFDTGSEVAPKGTRIVFPRPGNARVVFLARNPNAPYEELWSICVDKSIPSDLSDFWSDPNVQQLSYNELVETMRSYDPSLTPPPPAV